MSTLVTALAYLSGFLRTALFVVAAVLAVVFLIDWLVRTRRINPFNPIARFFRQTVDPLIAPVERQVVRAGGLPTAAPWWALVAVVVGGILLITVLDFLRRWLVQLAYAVSAGPGVLIVQLLIWALGIVQIALLLRVVASWLRISEYRWWLRWAVRLTDPILRPLRRIVPPLGMIDITPLVAYFGIWILQMLIRSLL
ncbi:MAG TPA: YggT family protein [Gemmatimonadaceae bacterium]|nr:YggT family protein [Gemmatimonadaceae bacterium]